MEKMTAMKAIKTYFSEGTRTVTFDELKALTAADRNELAPLCASALGVELVAA